MVTRFEHRIRLMRLLPFAVAVLALACTDGATSDQGEDDAITSVPLLLASASVGLPPADISVADLPDPESSGAQLVGKYCSACHVVTTPTTHSATDWPIVLRRMWMRMDNLAPAFNVPIPTSAERLAMLNYLRDNALQVSAEGLPDAPGRDTFVATCGQCHDLPDPMQHSPEDWVAVVQRMSGRMETMLEKPLDQQNFTRIVLYLESLTKRAG